MSQKAQETQEMNMIQVAGFRRRRQALVYSSYPLLCESPSPLWLLAIDSNSLSIAGIDQGVDGSLVVILTCFNIIVHCSLHIRRHYLPISVLLYFSL